MSLAANKIQEAIYARLTAQIPGTPVYDYVPPGAAAPYILIGQDTSIAWDTKTSDGQEFLLTIHAWAKAAGKKSVKAILQDIYAALHHQEAALNSATLTAASLNLVVLRFDFQDIVQEAGVQGNNDHYYHGIIRFRALIET